MYHITTIIASFCIVQVSVQSKQVQPRKELGIINGQRTTPGDFPYQAAIMGPHFIGGGSLISRSYVLTAAHCVVGFNAMGVLLGTYSLFARSPHAIMIEVERVFIHADYNYWIPTADIATLKLVTPVTPNNNISIVRLPPLNYFHRNYTNVVATIAGWGAIQYSTRTRKYKMATALRKTEVHLIPIDRCNAEGHHASEQIEMCGVGMNNRALCMGDSGGPLMFEGIQIGIMSRGDPQCRLHKSEVFTNVGKYMEWIQRYSNVRITQ